MAKKKIKLALIGCGGNMRNAHVPRIQADGKVDLVGVADPVEGQARLLMEKWGSEIPWFTDFRKMIREAAPDAIAISSPHSMHYEQASHCLRKGLHVLIEKPLTTTSRHARSLISLSEKHKRLLVVSYQRHFLAPHMFARELVRKGELGEIRGIVSYVTQNWEGVKGWRLVPELSGGGMFMDTGSHLVAATLWITGLQPSEVSALLDNAGQDVDINTVVSIRFKNGAVGTLNTFGNASRHDERVAIHGNKGCLVFHLHQWGIRSVLLNDEPIEIPKRIRESSPDAEFFKWIRNGGKGYEPPDFALQVSRLTEAVYKSVAGKRPVKVR
ncbi:MAG: Gfo/Idh/MocA family oxidoreductase [Planctomycetota bacterium]|jgi:predicted dehydrogenase|nr:Gfo/Idh/MocA family oxidoreductase [Planctomycetota bacterium]